PEVLDSDSGRLPMSTSISRSRSSEKSSFPAKTRDGTLVSSSPEQGRSMMRMAIGDLPLPFDTQRMPSDRSRWTVAAGRVPIAPSCRRSKDADHRTYPRNLNDHRVEAASDAGGRRARARADRGPGPDAPPEPGRLADDHRRDRRRGQSSGPALAGDPRG